VPSAGDRAIEEEGMLTLKRWRWVALAGAVVLAGCGIARERASQNAPVASGYGPHAAPMPAAETQLAARPARFAAPAATPSAADPLAAVAAGRLDRYLIRNATLTLEARDVRAAAAKLGAAVTAARGYTSESGESVDALGARSITLQARVPYDRFDRVLREVEALGKIMEKQIGTEDVTEEFVDSQARLRNLRRAEARLLEHLNRTGRLADVLLVETQLNRVRGDIEQLEGRLRFLTHRVTFSTLAVTLREAPRPQAMVPPESFSSGQEASAAARSLVAFAQTLWTGAIWIGIWAAVWLPLVLVAWLLARRLRRLTRPEIPSPSGGI
jgi:hypothetical protein